MNQENNRAERDSAPASTDIAVIGIAGRFPGARDVQAFWNNLRSGVESIRFFSEEELLGQGVPAELLRNPNYVRAKGILSDVDCFDAGFFGISPAEARLMDPQQRLLIECAWEVLEDAGYAPGQLQERVGMHVGVGSNRYASEHVWPSLKGEHWLEHVEAAIGNEKDTAATRIAYLLDMKGPCFTVQTFCSSSLVAVHQAVSSLLNQECDIALAGGAYVEVPHVVGYLHREGSFTSPDGHCRAFDAGAAGTPFGSAVALVALKRLEDALEDNDAIYGVIKGSAINNDGSQRAGYAAPSADGQAQVISEALGMAGAEPESISYVEAHGTGTSLGDPIEISALTRALSRGGRPHPGCLLGSVKTNIGHTDRASGVVSLIKVLQALAHGEIPPTLHFSKPNPAIDFGPFEVPTRLREWPRRDTPRRAGVSSFGLGGTNAHVIVEEAPLQPARTGVRSPQLVLLSARTPQALDEMAEALARRLRRQPQALADVAFTLQVGRRGFEHALGVIGTSPEEVAQALEERRPSFRGPRLQEPPALAFLFPGEAPQQTETSGALCERWPTFRETVERGAAFLQRELGWDVRHASRTLPRAHAALFLAEYALAQQWAAWGIRPERVVGVGLGELVAACVAGVLGLEDALRLTVRRAELLQASAGPQAPGAASVQEGLRGMLQQTPLRAPTSPLHSATTGDLISTAETQSPEFWARRLGAPAAHHVRFEPPSRPQRTVLLNVAPEPALTRIQLQAPPQVSVVNPLPEAEGPEQAVNHILLAAGALWMAGAELDWKTLHAPQRPRRAHLPTYPFARERHWVEAPDQGARPRGGLAPGEALEKSKEPAGWLYVPTWRRALPLPSPKRTPMRQRWLVLADTQGLGSELTEVLLGLGQLVYEVRAGPRNEAISPYTFQLDPSSTDGFKALSEWLEQPVDHLFHLWPFDLGEGVTHERRLRLGLESVFGLVQALGQKWPTAPTALRVVAPHAFDVTGGVAPIPEAAALAGPCKVISLEYPTWTSQLVDLEPSTDRGQLAQAARWLVREALGASGDDVVAYRSGVRWLRAYEPLPSTHLDAAEQGFREHGTYVITGGLGGVGLALAERLARHFRARLVLLGRTGLSAPHAQSLAERIRGMEAAGAEVLVIAADVAEPSSLRTALQQAQERFGSIQGVLHAAAVLRDGPIQLKHMEAMHEVLRPKLDGARTLLTAASDFKMEFVILFSSLAAVLGNVGQADYAAANAALDALAHGHVQDRPRVLSINWDAWLEVGAAHALRASAAPQARGPLAWLLDEGLTVEEGWEVLQMALRAGPCPQLVVSTRHLGRLAEKMRQALREEAHEKRTDALPEVSRERLTTRHVAPRNDTERLIAQAWTRHLGLRGIGVYDRFVDLGGHSLIAIRVLAELKNHFGVDLPLGAIFRAPTIAELAEAIEQALLDEVGALSEEEASRLAAEAGAAQEHVVKLPNQLEVSCDQPAEIEQFYEDIFVDRAYLRHGITLVPGDVVFDVGAHVGMFTLFTQRYTHGVEVYSFEPAPRSFEHLSRNTAWCGPSVRRLNFGLSDRRKQAELTFYRGTAGLSSVYGDPTEERDILRQVILNEAHRRGEDLALLSDRMEELLDQRLAAERVPCQFEMLSSVVRSQGLQHINLMKIDVQKSEMDVLMGIEEQDWPRIEQIVAEVHDTGDRVQQMHELLRTRGFQVASEQEPLYRGSKLYLLYAVRPERQARLEASLRGGSARPAGGTP
uniref:Phenolphthiocerol/phthiocerol polyketide synthase subunit E n=1 Tax=Myxococcus virescens TaxID=83456 RepID=A0A0N7AYN3_9BACT|nr:polyketide synthase [Myxococcus virescens]